MTWKMTQMTKNSIKKKWGQIKSEMSEDDNIYEISDKGIKRLVGTRVFTPI